MKRRGLTSVLAVGAGVLLVLGTMIVGSAQRGRSSVLEDGPWTYRTADAEVRAVVVAKGLSHPWSIAFLPNGDDYRYYRIAWPSPESEESGPQSFLAEMVKERREPFLLPFLCNFPYALQRQ